MGKDRVADYSAAVSEYSEKRGWCLAWFMMMVNCTHTKFFASKARIYSYANPEGFASLFPLSRAAQ